MFNPNFKQRLKTKIRKANKFYCNKLFKRQKAKLRRSRKNTKQGGFKLSQSYELVNSAVQKHSNKKSNHNTNTSVTTAASFANSN
jgi:hypothetical protein